jgi:hypothetical protein
MLISARRRAPLSLRVAENSFHAGIPARNAPFGVHQEYEKIRQLGDGGAHRAEHRQPSRVSQRSGLAIGVRQCAAGHTRGTSKRTPSWAGGPVLHRTGN